MEEAVQFPNWSANTILIAEDMDDNFTVLMALLKKTHIKILRAKNGCEAINLTRENPAINLILMDISMPVIDGFEATRIIKQEFPKKAIIAQTAHELSIQITNKEFNDILLKPIRRSQLLETLNKYLS